MKLLMVLFALMAVMLNSVMSVTGKAALQCRCECPQTQSYEILSLDGPQPAYNTPRQPQYSIEYA